MSDHLGAAWREYRTKVIPLEASADQATECRRAFYAGAVAMLEAMLTGLDPGEEPTPADVAKLEALHAELLAFSDAVKAGRA